MSQMSLRVCVVTFDTPPALLETTLSSVIRAIDKVTDLCASVCVVNNGQAHPPKIEWPPRAAGSTTVELCHLPENPGYGAANNRALKSGSEDYVLVLNPDVELADDALEVALAFMAHNADVVAVAPRTVNDAGEREFLCKQNPGVFTFLLRGFATAFIKARFEKRLADFEMRSETADGVAVADVPIASGCCLLVRGDAYRALGGFDERYFLYFEDFDLCVRLGAHGRIVYLGAMNVVHHGGNAARKGLWHIRQFLLSGWRFFATNGWRW